MINISHQLNDIYCNKTMELTEWFAEHYADKTALFYSSVDVRNSGFKIAPVDTNLFPAGFNNLSPLSIDYAASITKKMINRDHPNAKKLLIIPENHTRNQGYIDNLQQLCNIFSKAGFEAKVGRMADGGAEGAGEEAKLLASDGKTILSTPIERKNNIISTIGGDSFTPDIIIVNNDLTSGAPEILCCIEQPARPPIGMGWYRRRKSVYFTAYDKIIEKFAERFAIDPWLMSTYSHQCGVINFKERKGIECVAIGVEKVLHKLRLKYEEYGIKEEPYVFIKADSGTYGMGIMTAHSGEEIYEMNKKNRKKMNIIKEGAQNTEVIIQEGVPTNDVIDGMSSEPMIYLMDGKLIGGAWRINESRDKYKSLNASGMKFSPFTNDFSNLDARFEADAGLNSSRLIAELASLSATYEEY